MLTFNLPQTRNKIKINGSYADVVQQHIPVAIIDSKDTGTIKSDKLIYIMRP